ncbi:hypothetical protein Tco_0868683, partial [Tanacetum coccineum]
MAISCLKSTPYLAIRFKTKSLNHRFLRKRGLKKNKGSLVSLLPCNVSGIRRDVVVVKEMAEKDAFVLTTPIPEGGGDNDDYVCRGLILKDKLLLPWKVFKHTLKHNKEELSFVELGSHLRIEESLRVQDSDKPKSNNVAGPQSVVRLPDPKLKTLGEKGNEGIFVGYVEHSKAFRFYVIDPNDLVSINSIIESMDAIFDENRFSSVPRPSLRIPNGTEDIG